MGQDHGRAIYQRLTEKQDSIIVDEPVQKKFCDLLFNDVEHHTRDKAFVGYTKLLEQVSYPPALLAVAKLLHTLIDLENRGISQSELDKIQLLPFVKESGDELLTRADNYLDLAIAQGSSIATTYFRKRQANLKRLQEDLKEVDQINIDCMDGSLRSFIALICVDLYRSIHLYTQRATKEQQLVFLKQVLPMFLSNSELKTVDLHFKDLFLLAFSMHAFITTENQYELMGKFIETRIISEDFLLTTLMSDKFDSDHRQQLLSTLEPNLRKLAQHPDYLVALSTLYRLYTKHHSLFPKNSIRDNNWQRLAVAVGNKVALGKVELYFNSIIEKTNLSFTELHLIIYERSLIRNLFAGETSYQPKIKSEFVFENENAEFARLYNEIADREHPVIILDRYQNNPLMLHMLGLCYMFSYKVKRDYREAASYFYRACIAAKTFIMSESLAWLEALAEGLQLDQYKEKFRIAEQHINGTKATASHQPIAGNLAIGTQPQAAKKQSSKTGYNDWCGKLLFMNNHNIDVNLGNLSISKYKMLIHSVTEDHLIRLLPHLARFILDLMGSPVYADNKKGDDLIITTVSMELFWEKLEQKSDLGMMSREFFKTILLSPYTDIKKIIISVNALDELQHDTLCIDLIFAILDRSARKDNNSTAYNKLAIIYGEGIKPAPQFPLFADGFRIIATQLDKKETDYKEVQFHQAAIDNIFTVGMSHRDVWKHIAPSPSLFNSPQPIDTEGNANNSSDDRVLKR